eukprot:scaffold128218_cov45-Phaeocystis_antarctica.AAC.1
MLLLYACYASRLLLPQLVHELGHLGGPRLLLAVDRRRGRRRRLPEHGCGDARGARAWPRGGAGGGGGGCFANLLSVEVLAVDVIVLAEHGLHRSIGRLTAWRLAGATPASAATAAAAAHVAVVDRVSLDKALGAAGFLKVADPLRVLGGELLLLLLALRLEGLFVLLEGRLLRAAEREGRQLVRGHVTHGARLDGARGQPEG